MLYVDTFLPQYTCKLTEMLSCNYSELLVITYGVLSWGLIYQKLSDESFSSLWTERRCLHLFSQHLMQVMNCGGSTKCAGCTISLSTEKLSLYICLIQHLMKGINCHGQNSLCAGFSTDGTTLCCRHVGNSWQSTLKNLHVVNTCPQSCRWQQLLQWIVSPVLKNTRYHIKNYINMDFFMCVVF